MVKDDTYFPLRFATEEDKQEAMRIAGEKNRSLNNYLLTLFYADRRKHRTSEQSANGGGPPASKTDGPAVRNSPPINHEQRRARADEN